MVAFLFDLNSPFAYLAAERIDAVMPGEVQWRPIVFGALLRSQERVPWSMRPDERESGIAEVERRARERGLPEVTWPEGWPLKTYSVPALRAATWALGRDQALGRRLTLELFRAMFVGGSPLSDPETVVEAARRVGIGREDLLAGMEDPVVKETLHASTDAAIAAGVPGVPTVLVGSAQYWGDDRLEEAARVSSVGLPG